MLVDSHCHLDFPELAAERAAVLERAAAAGVGTLVTICTKLTEFPRVAAIAEAHPAIWCSVGIHPHEAAHQPEATTAALLERARHPKVVGIGETGLDFYYDHSPRDRQAEVFRAHIAAASAAGLPLIVHSREADRETADLLAEGAASGPLTGVIHCFTSGPYLAEKALELGFYISLSGILTFRNAKVLQEIARTLPADRMLVETDAPFLAPVPERGKRNEPAFVAHTARFLAGLRGESPEAIAQQTTENFFRLFGRARRPAETEAA
jgi:TatD DNase family protein